MSDRARTTVSRRLAGPTIVLLLAMGLLAPTAQSSSIRPGTVDPGLLAHASASDGVLRVIVRETEPSTQAAEDVVDSLGGTVGSQLEIVGGFAARIPADGLAELASSSAIARVWGDGRITVNQYLGEGEGDEGDEGEEGEGDEGEGEGDEGVDMGQFDQWPANRVWRRSIRLPLVEAAGYTGAGVTVAVLDTGISPVADLDGRVIARVDFTPELNGYDHYGHGTHMAGIIAGNGASSGGDWRGVAPGANLVSVKVAGADGSTDVSVVLAGLQWIVSHQDEYGIKVLNLAFGTDSIQPYEIDPLNYAVERVWFSGIFVVVSAGNRGSDASTISKPGDDPFVLTVGAADLKETVAVNDDAIAEFSSRGPTLGGFTKPDISAPGVTIVSSRVAGGTIDANHPLARMGDAYFKGSGTSQAAAVVSGIAALMYEANPGLTPDVAKAIIMRTARSARALGDAPLVDAALALYATVSHRYDNSPANQGLVPSSGQGSLEASRGSLHVYVDLDGDGIWEPVVGEVDVLGQIWDARSWSARSWSAEEWGATIWSELAAEALAWDARSWSARSWSGTSWDARSWSGDTWDARSWSGETWS